MNDTLPVGGHLGIMGHEDDGDAPLPVESLEEIDDLRAGAGVEVSGGLVRQDDPGIVEQCPCDGHPLLLTAGQLRGPVRFPLAEPYEREHLPRLAAARRRRRSVVEGRQFGVLQGRGPGQKVVVLEDEADLVVAHPRHLVGRKVAHVLAVQTVVARGRPVQKTQQVHEGRLARPGRPHERHDLPLEDRERHALQGLHSLLAKIVDLGDAVHFDDGRPVHGVRDLPGSASARATWCWWRVSWPRSGCRR